MVLEQLIHRVYVNIARNADSFKVLICDYLQLLTFYVFLYKSTVDLFETTPQKSAAFQISTTLSIFDGVISARLKIHGVRYCAPWWNYTLILICAIWTFFHNNATFSQRSWLEQYLWMMGYLLANTHNCSKNNQRSSQTYFFAFFMLLIIKIALDARLSFIKGILYE